MWKGQRSQGCLQAGHTLPVAVQGLERRPGRQPHVLRLAPCVTVSPAPLSSGSLAVFRSCGLAGPFPPYIPSTLGHCRVFPHITHVYSRHDFVLVFKGSAGQKVGGTLMRVIRGLTLHLGKLPPPVTFPKKYALCPLAPLKHSGSFLGL